MKNRFVLFDITRALCVIWIVGIWHMNEYMNVECKFFQDDSSIKEVFSILTNGVLAAFTFISGYFMSKKLISGWNDVLKFYKKRIIRFMIPLLSSSIILSIGGMILPIHTLTICTGVSQFLSPPWPMTLWYFSMMIFFYVITPVLIWLKSLKNIYCLLFCICIYSFLYIGHIYFGFDKRIANNSLFYMLPFLFNTSKILPYNFSKLCRLLIIVGMNIVLYMTFVQKISLEVVSSIIICYMLVTVSSFLALVPPLVKLFSSISYASMFAYLFHRELYIVTYKLLGSYSQADAAIWLLVLFIFSYLGQYLYDSFLKNLLNRKLCVDG